MKLSGVVFLEMFIVAVILFLSGCTQQAIEEEPIKLEGGVLEKKIDDKKIYEIRVDPATKQVVIQKGNDIKVLKIKELKTSSISIIIDSKEHVFNLAYNMDGYRNLTGLKITSNYMQIKLKEITPKRDVLPLAYKLENLPPVFDQQTLSSCVSCALAYVKTWQEGKERSWKSFDSSQYFSGLYFYNQVNGGNNFGTAYPDNFEIAKKGSALLSAFEYTTDYLKQPDVNVITDAYQYRILDYSRININPVSIKEALASGYPVLVSLKVYSPQFWLDPVYSEANINVLSINKGYHAITIVGYDDATNNFIFANSWGKLWNDNGFGYLSYESVNSFIIEAFITDDYIAVQ